MSGEPEVVERPSPLPAIILALVPLALLPGCWLWWWAASLRPGVQVGRSADLVLAIGAGFAAWLVHRRGGAPRPALPLLLALAWQGLALALWAPVQEPGLVWLVERAAALAAAVGLGLWLAPRRDLGPAGAGAALAGLGLLALTCLSAYHDLGSALAIGEEAPFGNVNFNVGAALPLCFIGIARFLHGGTWRWTAYALAAAGLAGLLGAGTLGTDPCKAVWVVGGAGIAAALILRLPARVHLPAFAIAAGAALALWALFVAGAIDPLRLGSGAGTLQRIPIWQAAVQALSGAHATVGYGPGAAIAALPEQPAFAASWLTVPSHLEHAHNEALQVLLDGGVVLAGLLGWGLWLTLRGLWQRRHEPMPAALLVGWCAAGAHALIESHLSQPGGLLMLAILAGASWACAPPWALRAPAAAAAPALAAMALLALLLGELFGDVGTPGELQRRLDLRLAGLGDAAALAEFDRLRARVGPLDQLDYQRARLLGRLGRGVEADALLAAQLRRLPVHAPSLELAARRCQRGRAAPELVAATAAARTRAAAVLATMRESGRNQEAIAALRRALERDRPGDPAPAP